VSEGRGYCEGLGSRQKSREGENMETGIIGCATGTLGDEREMGGR